MTKKENPLETSPLQRRMRLQSGLIVVLGLAFLFQLVQLYRFQARIDFIDQLGAQQGVELGDSFLGESEEEEVSLNSLMFSFVQNLGTYEANKVRYEANLAFLQEKLKAQDWSVYELRLENPEGRYAETAVEYVFVSTVTGKTLAILSLGYDGTLGVSTYNAELVLQSKESAEQSFQDFLLFCEQDLPLLKQTADEVDAVRASLQAFLSTESVQTLFTTKKLSVQTEIEKDEHYSVLLFNADGTSVAEWRISKTSQNLTLETLNPAQILSVDLSTPETQAELLSSLEQIDARSALEKQVDATKEELASIFADPAFVYALSTVSFHFGATVETEARVEYPLLNANEEVLRVLILDKTTGEVKVSLPDGSEVQELSYAVQVLESTSKKKLWTYLV